MSTTTVFHLRALVCASVHLALSAVLGAVVLGLAVADVMTTSSELPPPWWITGGYWLLMLLSAPMAAFFGLWKDPAWTQIMSLFMALAWSALLGYLASFIWRGIEKAVLNRANKALHATAATPAG
ncbi:MAG: hypothetical protein ACLQU3_04960 [Limisphaerales bacterium]